MLGVDRCLVSDVSGDWIGKLEEVNEEAGEDFYDQLAEIRATANVIDFAKWAARRRMGLFPPSAKV